MLRRRPLQTWFAPLALAAMALMLCAPLVSRCLQGSGPRSAELCTPEGLRQVVLDATGMPSMPGHAMDHAATAAMAHAGRAHHGEPVGAGEHASHGEAACDYCVLAVRLLPALLWLLALLLVRTPAMPVPATAATPLRRLTWPAHPARGPPLYA